MLVKHFDLLNLELLVKLRKSKKTECISSIKFECSEYKLNIKLNNTFEINQS